MRTRRTILAGSSSLLLIAWAVGVAAAQSMPNTPQTPQTPTTPSTPSNPLDMLSQPPSTNPAENPAANAAADMGQFAQAPAAGTAAAGGFDPGMIGDSFGATVSRTIQVPTGRFITVVQPGPNGTTGTSRVIPQTRSETIVIPVLTRGTTSKAAENEPVRPEDRVFANFNYYNNVIGGGNVYNEWFGFEKTFLDGNASIGLRVPIIQSNGDGSLDEHDIGDLSVILKCACINTPNLCLSTGLVVTAPTGPDVILGDGTQVNDTLIQPFLGYFETTGRFWLQAFTSVEVPTDHRDVILMYSDLGTGYWIWQSAPDRLISGVAPTVEAHITTPLNHRDRMESDVISGLDIVDITAGAIIQLRGRSTLSLGVCTPVTGPRPFDVEALAQFSLRF